MTTTPQYDQLLAEVNDDLERQVIDLLLQAWEKGQPTCSRLYLITCALHLNPAAIGNLSSSPADRKVRKAIERLRAKGWPIVSSSGEAGYALEDDEAKIRSFAAEQESRAERNRENARAAYGWLTKARAIREFKRTQAPVIQERLL